MYADANVKFHYDVNITGFTKFYKTNNHTPHYMGVLPESSLLPIYTRNARCSEVPAHTAVTMGNRTAFLVAFLLRSIYGGLQIVSKDALI
jgi:hypothetical protein